jgi:hypothetical protein
MKNNFTFLVLLSVSLLWSQNNKACKLYCAEFSKVQFSNPELSKEYLDSILLLPNLTDRLISETDSDFGTYNAVISEYDGATPYFNNQECTDTLPFLNKSSDYRIAILLHH